VSSGAITLFFFWFTRSLSKSALIASAGVILFFSHGHIHAWLYRFAETDYGLLEGLLDLVLTVLWVLVMVSLVRRVLPLEESSLRRWNSTLNVGSAALLVLLFAGLVVRTAALGVEEPVKRSAEFELTESQHSTIGYRPDIYFIVMDSYGRNDVLERHFDYSNSEFTASLEDLGFNVLPESRANYYWTHLSLASTLNMRHVLEIEEECDSGHCELARANRLIQDNEVVRILRAKGYKYVHFDSTWFATLRNLSADIEIRYAGTLFTNEFYRLLALSSWVRVFGSSVSVDLASIHLANFERLKEIVHTEGPKFVFAHFIPPHYPYLFDREGNVLKRATAINQLVYVVPRDEKSYIDQLVFVNSRILDVVKHIVRTSERPPIIVLCSDHGPQVYDAEEQVAQRGRLANFAAFFLPEGDGLFPAGTTNVNFFPRLFNFYFESGIPIQPNRSYYSAYGAHHFEEVTFDGSTSEPRQQE
jgi:hypothetical protein